MSIAELLRALPDAALAERGALSPEQHAAVLRSLPDVELERACGYGETAPKRKPKPRKPKPEAAPASAAGDGDEKYLAGILEWAREDMSVSFSLGDVADASGLDKARASKLVGALVRAGVLIRSGKGRGTRFAPATKPTREE